MGFAECPQVPGTHRYRIKARYRAEASSRFGDAYSRAVLCRRSQDDGESLFAPVTLGPGGIAVFTWPAVHLVEGWLEPE